MEQPTTPRTRRAAWKGDALAIIEEFQAHARGEGRESFPPWRIGYMAGLSNVREAGSEYFLMRMHRRAPHHMEDEVVIPKQGRPSQALIDLLCWHIDQDVRRHELDHVDHLDLWHRLPSGPLLIDPLLHVVMEEAGMDEDSLCCRIRDADGFGTKKSVNVRIGATAVELTIRYNEVHARFEIPRSNAAWNRGHLVFKADDLPLTVMAAAKGRRLDEFVEHEIFRSAREMHIASIVHTDGKCTIRTNSAHAEGMMPMPQRKRIAA